MDRPASTLTRGVRASNLTSIEDKGGRVDPFADARANLAALAAEHTDSTGLNEATTRFRIIDQLLHRCLGWPTAEVNCERHHSNEYTDYELGARAIEAIVEAKKEGLYFRVPAGVEGRRVVEIQTLLTDKNTKQAIEQVAGYCQQRGVSLGIVSNGHQLIAFYASRQDGLPPLEGQALVYSSLQEMLEDFPSFWGHLSREGIAARSLQRVLLGMRGAHNPPSKLSDEIPNYPGFRVRSGLETDLKMLAGVFIQDLEDEESISKDFLRECYSSSGALSQYALVSREILATKYAAVDESGVTTESVRGTRGLNPLVSQDLVASALSRRPIILLGDVGVGKSMFLKHLLTIEAADVLEAAQVFYVNFGSEPAIDTNLEEYVYRRIRTQLREKYGVDVSDAGLIRAVYNGEINRFKKSLAGEFRESDPERYQRAEFEMLSELASTSSAHLKRVFEHQRGTQQKKSIVVLDNVDQRPAEFQDRVFVIAQALANTWPATVFVALRPSTFYESRQKGALAAYQPRVFTVSPTRVDGVVRKRLDYAIRQVTVQRESGSFPEHMSLSSDDLLTYLEVVVSAFEENRDLNLLLDNISGGNLRVALTYLSNFIGSGYVSTERVLDAASRGSRYQVPLHEFLRSIIFGEYEYFTPQLSDICNIFDITSDDPREHFLLPILLAHIQHVGESARSDSFVDASEIFQLAQTLGFQAEQTAAQLERGVAKKLIEPRYGHGLDGPFRITSVGAYMYRNMPRHFVYLDGMVVDTPITDVHVQRRLKQASSISDRLDRSESFLDYLDNIWNTWGVAGTIRFNWNDLSDACRADVTSAREKVRRAAERRAQD